MSKTQTTWAVRLLSIVMILTLALSNVASVSGVGSPLDSTSAAMTADLEINDVTDQVDSFMSSEYALTDDTYHRYTSEELVWVIVEMKDEALIDRYLSKSSAYPSVREYAETKEAQSYISSLESKQNQLIRELDSKIEIVSKYNYTTILNGFAAQIRYKDLAYLEGHAKVSNVILSEQYDRPYSEVTTNDVNVYDTGIYDSSNVDYDGEGTVVAVLDTGLDYTHTAFQKQPQGELAITRDDVDSIIDESSAAYMAANREENAFTLKTDQVYLSNKVPFAFDYADHDADVYPIEDHGTHVAGIIAGQDEEITGVATEAQLAIMKVFPDDPASGSETTDILAALSDCVLLNVDAINMSLGSSAGFAREKDGDQINTIYDKIRDSGISLIVAASNDYSSAMQGRYGDTNLTSNPDSGTVGSPASYEASLAVASIAGVKTKYMIANGETPVYITESATVSGDKNDFIGDLVKKYGQTTLEYVTVPGLGQRGDYIGLDVTGKIALVKRGSNTFEDKINIAQSKGAIACIIYNNVTGNISMSVGKQAVIPSCSIDMELGKILSAKASGTLQISSDYEAGPFMSDFSSWGVLPNLELKPDITAHGGEIYSAVRGGYDRISGTSMACPNMAGATILVREYVKQTFPNLSAPEVTELTYQLMMSTATIANNPDGNPYSPRKQGAGLADIEKAINTDAYLWVEGENKTKLSLGDDKQKTGKYELNFKLTNLSRYARSYRVNPSIMTETVSSDGKTVAEKAYMFRDSKVTVKAGGKEMPNGIVAVTGYGTIDITVTIELTDGEKAYLDENFKNGMYVEGFVSLASMDQGVDLTIPYLAFYGDWTSAPMFDVTAYEVGASQEDSSVLEKDKLQADVYATLPMGGFKYQISDTEYETGVWGLGEYGYKLEDESRKPATIEEHAAISANDSAYYQLNSIYAGLLRGAKEMKMQLMDKTTGEILYEDTYVNARKSYFSGARRPGFIELNLDTAAYGLKNNTTYTFSMEGKLDYEGAHSTQRNTFSFDFYVDSESPILREDMTTVRIEKQSDGSLRYYLDMYVYDNHYIQCYALASIQGIASDGTLIDRKAMFENTEPVTGGFGVTNKITYQISSSDWNYLFNNGRMLYVEFIDYAKNTSAFSIQLPEVDAEAFTFGKVSDSRYTVAVGQSLDVTKFMSINPFGSWTDDIVWASSDESKVTVDKGVITAHAASAGTVTVTATKGTTKQTYRITVTEEESYTVKTNEFLDLETQLTMYPSNSWRELLTWESSDPQIADVSKDGLVCGVSEGETTITVSSRTGASYPVKVVVTSGTRPDVTLRGLELNYTSYSLDQGEEFELQVEINPWNLETMPKLTWTSFDSSIVSITPTDDPTRVIVKAVNASPDTAASGYISVRAEGYASIVGNCYITVKPPFKLDGVYLQSYNGRGDENGVVEIPGDLGIRYIYQYAFFGNEYVTKVILPDGIIEIGEAAFYGMPNLKEVEINPDCTLVGTWAFGWNPSLEKVTLRKDAEGKSKMVTVGELSFYNCPKLSEFDFANLHYIGPRAFFGASSLREVDLTNVGFTGTQAFARCSSLSSIIMSENTQIGEAAFVSCTALTNLVIPTDYVGYSAFNGCTSLEYVTFTNDVDMLDAGSFYGCTSLKNVFFRGTLRSIGDAAFADCTALTEFTLPDGIEEIGATAFANCSALATVKISAGAKLFTLDQGSFGGCPKITAFQVEDGNSYLMSQDGILFDKSGKKLLLVPYGKKLSGTYTVPSYVTEIGAYAFANLSVTSVRLNNVSYIGEGAFYNCKNLATVTFSDNLREIGESAFYACVSLRNITLPENLEVIGQSAFWGCEYSSVAYELVIPDSVKEIGFNAFRGMAGLKKLVVGTGVSELPGQVLAQCTNLTEVEFRGDNVKRIGEYAFTLCSELVTFEMPDSVEEVGEYAFAACQKLTSVKFSDKVTKIPDGCFAGCGAMAEFTAPDAVTEIGNYVFATFTYDTTVYGCASLTSVDLNNVTKVGTAAFSAVTSSMKIAQISAPNLVEIGDAAFAHLPMLETLSLPKAETIGGSAFLGAISLNSLSLPEVRTIGENAFMGCTSLTAVELPKVETIASEAFAQCEKLASAAFPVVKSIGDLAFSENALESVTLPATLEALGIEVFSYNSALKQISVASENKNYFVEGGVLYRNLPNGGLELIMYPMGLEATEYAVKEGTLRIDDAAFIGQKHLEKVTLPQSLRSIGHEAFYGSTVRTYVFLSKDAPVLESEFVLEDQNAKKYLGYRNFVDSIYNAAELGLTMICPANGNGYTEYVWTLYFHDVKTAEAAASAQAVDQSTAAASARQSAGAAIGGAGILAASVHSAPAWMGPVLCGTSVCAFIAGFVLVKGRKSRRS